MKKSLFTIRFFLLISLIVFINCTTNTPNNTLKPVSSKNFKNITTVPGIGEVKVFFTLYMVGSDLEDDISPRNKIPDEDDNKKLSTKGAGTADLKEIINGYNKLSDTEKKRIEILVAFGGARKEGWKGIKYADIKCLEKDNSDSYFGNENCYAFSNKNANMGEQKTYEDYLKFVRTKYNGFYNKIGIIWDHGTAYVGIGQDTNFKNDHIKLSELGGALKNANVKFDIFGFDACLMACIEVAKAIKDFGTYMVASEEIEPGHGWNYNGLIEFLGKSPGSNQVDIGKYIIDTFIESPEHKYTIDKTLSLISLGNVDSTINDLNSLINELKNNKGSLDFPSILNSVTSSQQFGKIGKGSIEYSIDLKDFAEHIRINKKNSYSSVENLNNSLKKLVIYSRQDGSKPNSNGISIFSVNNKKFWKNNLYTEDIAPSSSWYSFAKDFIAIGLNDPLGPSFQNQRGCSYEGEKGYCVKMSDNLGFQNVRASYSLKTGNNTFMILGEGAAEETGTSNTYFLPKWDGKWFRLCNGTCNDSNSIFPSATFNDYTKKGNMIYSANAKFNGEEVLFFIEFEPNSKKIVDNWVIPVETNEQGEHIISRLRYTVEQGDNLQFYYKTVDTAKNQEKTDLGQQITITGQPVWSYDTLNGNPYYFIVGEDYNEKIENSVELKPDGFAPDIPANTNPSPGPTSIPTPMPTPTPVETFPEEPVNKERVEAKYETVDNIGYNQIDIVKEENEKKEDVKNEIPPEPIPEPTPDPGPTVEPTPEPTAPPDKCTFDNPFVSTNTNTLP